MDEGKDRKDGKNRKVGKVGEIGKVGKDACDSMIHSNIDKYRIDKFGMTPRGPTKSGGEPAKSGHDSGDLGRIETLELCHGIRWHYIDFLFKSLLSRPNILNVRS